VNVSFPLVLGFVLVLFRVSALMLTAPVLSSRSIPGRIKLALSLFVAVVGFVAAAMPKVAVPANFGALMGLVVAETVIGLSAGLASRLLLDAAQFGGQAASGSMGFGFGQIINPNSNADSTTIGELYSALALSVAVGLGIHREAIAWIVQSIQQVPPGGTLELASLASAMVRQIIYALTLAVRVAYPVFAAAVFGFGMLGALGKASPQLSLTNLGFAVSILAGGGAVYLVAPDGARVCAEAAFQVFSRG
jgi:flagellar biosynthetic protein FliR